MSSKPGLLLLRDSLNMTFQNCSALDKVYVSVLKEIVVFFFIIETVFTIANSKRELLKKLIGRGQERKGLPFMVSFPRWLHCRWLATPMPGAFGAPT